MDTSNSEDHDWQDVRELEVRALQAFLAQNVVELSSLLSDDFIVNSPLNRILTKSELLDLLGKGVIRHLSYEERIERMIRHDDLVIVMGIDAVTNPNSGPIQRRFTNVWSVKNSSWEMVARHAHHISEIELDAPG